jgi:hypothetical protein
VPQLSVVPPENLDVEIQDGRRRLLTLQARCDWLLPPSLSEDHLDSYLQEFCWRYHRRHMRLFIFQTLAHERVNRKPLTYKTLTQEVF